MIGCLTGPTKKVTFTLTHMLLVVVRVILTVLAKDLCWISFPWASLRRGALSSVSASTHGAKLGGHMCSSDPLSRRARPCPLDVTLCTPVVVARSSVSGDVSASLRDKAATLPPVPELTVPPVLDPAALPEPAFAAWTRGPFWSFSLNLW